MQKLRRQIGNRLIWLVSKWIRDTQPRVIVLHDIDDAQAFYDRMVWLKSRYMIVSLDRAIQHRFTNSVTLTFDDCFASWHEVGMWVLNALGIPATFFVCSGRVGEGQRQNLPFDERIESYNRFLTEKELVDIASNELFTIGSHTINHTRIADGVPYKEIHGDIIRLKSIINKDINFFAYPYGQPEDITTESMLYLMRLGIKRAFSTIPQPVGQEFVSGRLSLSVSDPEWVWDARLRGGYDWMHRRLHGR